MIKRANFLMILLTALLPAAGTARYPLSEPYCGDVGPGGQFSRRAFNQCPEGLAVITLEGVLDLTLDPDMMNPYAGVDMSVRMVRIDCAICTGPSCDLGSGAVASQIHDVQQQTTVQVPYKTWFGIQGENQGGLPVNPADVHSYYCRVGVASSQTPTTFEFPSPFYPSAWDSQRWAKVMDTPTPVLELRGTIN